MINLQKRYLILLLILGAGLVTCTKDRSNFSSEILQDLPVEIKYSDSYDGHLQGFCSDFQNFIYWSHTRQLVKTDLKGKVLQSIDVQNHHGDLEFYKGKLYVAVNFGKFNEEPGLADSWVYVYDSALEFIEKFPVPEVVHGAGGIAIHDDRIMVVGGLPEAGKSSINYVYEYNMDLEFVKRHDIESGYTYKGIQTASHFDGKWYFACYGSKRLDVLPKVLQVGEDEQGNLKFENSFDRNMSYGMLGLQGNEFLFSNGEMNKLAIKGVLK